ncbi:lysosomal acid glucosylceramidase-like [Musca autumnalis]|uniref:lysosomal acid glucosylceramidase-like n=1 Tax=Musca autumnalis TaxID=221902 RepID=UPI003CF972E0
MEIHFKEFLIFLTFLVGINAVTTPCNLRETPEGGVCVCNSEYCDYLDDPTPESDVQYALVSSSRAGLRFSTTTSLFNRFSKQYVLDYDQLVERQQIDNITAHMSERATTRTVNLNIDREKQYRKIVGFGGSFTGAVSYLLEKLPQAVQDHLYKSYYGDDGLAFNLMRMSIGGCDFDLAPWAYNEEPANDANLSNFTKIDPRDQTKAEQIKRLMAVANPKNLRIKGAAWSAPPWMKTNNRWTGFGRLKKEYYQTWADYHLKWLEIMEENGLPIWAISTGNEPMNGLLFMYFVRFMSMGWHPLSQAAWLSDHLGPTIRNSKYKDLVIFGNDDQRYTFPTWFKLMKLSRRDSLNYLDGFAVHWYWDEIFKPTFIDNTLALYPEKILIMTESCIGDKPWQKAGPVLGSWYRGEKMARAFLQNLQHGYNGWIDWNLILDENGGPNYVDNTVDAPVIVDTANPSEILKQPIFYAMGHFSKFIPEGSVRIDAVRSNVNIDSVAYLRPDGSVAAVLFNSGNAQVEINVIDSVRGSAIIVLPPRSIHTMIYH